MDDEPLVRSGVRAILGSAADMGVVADCGGADAVATVARHRPDVLLLDIRMPDVDGLTVLRQVAALTPAPAVAMLTTFDAGEYVEAALTAGAAGFLMKNSSPEQLTHAVRVLATGGRILAPEATAPVIGAYLASTTTRDAARRVDALTERGTPCARPGGPRADQPRHRRAAAPGPLHGEGPCQRGAREAGRGEPRPGRGGRGPRGDGRAAGTGTMSAESLASGVPGPGPGALVSGASASGVPALGAPSPRPPPHADFVG
ncbi:response regulator [Streptomyces cyaneofuscatus]